MGNDETVLRDIDAAYRERQREGLSRREEWAAEGAHWQAKLAAVAAFADLNGWRKAPSFFDLRLLGRGASTRLDFWDIDQPVLDHPIWFRRDRRYVAAIGQPYPPAVSVPSWRDQLTTRGFVLHVPPDPLASIHFPGSCLFLVITLPGVEVRWLPEQDGRMAERWEPRWREIAAEATA